MAHALENLDNPIRVQALTEIFGINNRLPLKTVKLRITFILLYIIKRFRHFLV